MDKSVTADVRQSFSTLEQKISAFKNRQSFTEDDIAPLKKSLINITATNYVVLSEKHKDLEGLAGFLTDKYVALYESLHALNLFVVGGQDAVLTGDNAAAIYRQRAEQLLPSIFAKFSQDNEQNQDTSGQQIENLAQQIENIQLGERQPQNTLQLPPDITFEKVNGIILPPDPKAPETGSGTEWEESVNENRIAQVVNFFEAQKIPYHKKLLQGKDPAQNGHIRSPSYVIVTILDENDKSTPIAQLAVHDYSGEALYIVAPPQRNTFWTTTGKEALRAHAADEEKIPNLQHVKRILFDKQEEWKQTLLNFIAGSEALSSPEIQGRDTNETTSNTSTTRQRRKRSYTEIVEAILNSFKDQPIETLEAIKTAFQNEYNKPAKDISLKEIEEDDRELTIILPTDKTKVVIPSETLYKRLSKNGIPLMVLFGNVIAKNNQISSKIYAALENPETAASMKQAIRNAWYAALKTSTEETPALTTRDNLLEKITLPTRKNNPPLNILHKGEKYTIDSYPLRVGLQRKDKLPSFEQIVASSETLTAFTPCIRLAKLTDSAKKQIYSVFSNPTDPRLPPIILEIAEQIEGTKNNKTNDKLITFNFPFNQEETTVATDCKELSAFLSSRKRRSKETFPVTLTDIQDCYQELKQSNTLDSNDSQALMALLNRPKEPTTPPSTIVEILLDPDKAEGMKQAIRDAYAQAFDMLPKEISGAIIQGNKEKIVKIILYNQSYLIGAVSLLTQLPRQKKINGNIPTLPEILGRERVDSLARGKAAYIALSTLESNPTLALQIGEQLQKIDNLKTNTDLITLNVSPKSGAQEIEMPCCTLYKFFYDNKIPLSGSGLQLNKEVTLTEENKANDEFLTLQYIKAWYQQQETAAAAMLELKQHGLNSY
jgi:hypothetical protein